MRQDDLFRRPGDHALRGFAQRFAPPDEAHLHVNRRLAVRVGGARHLHQPPQKGVTHPSRLEVFDQVGDDQGLRGAVKKVDLGQEATGCDTLIERALPRLWRLINRCIVQNERAPSRARKARRTVGASLGEPIPPIGEIPMVQRIRRHEMANAAKIDKRCGYLVAPRYRRMDPEIATERL